VSLPVPCTHSGMSFNAPQWWLALPTLHSCLQRFRQIRTKYGEFTHYASKRNRRFKLRASVA
jgi:hypothetical protein